MKRLNTKINGMVIFSALISCWSSVSRWWTVSHTYCDVEGCDHVERGGEYCAHSLHWWLIQAVVSGQYLPMEDKAFYIHQAQDAYIKVGQYNLKLWHPVDYYSYKCIVQLYLCSSYFWLNIYIRSFKNVCYLSCK